MRAVQGRAAWTGPVESLGGELIPYDRTRADRLDGDTGLVPSRARLLERT